MARAICTISVALLVLTASAVSAQDGRLQQARDQINTSSSGGGSSSAPSSDSGCSDSDGGSALGVLAFYAVLSPFVLPPALLGDRYERRMPFTRYPYAEDYFGYQILTPEWAKAYYEIESENVTRKDWALRVSVENGNNFDGLNRLGGQVKLEHVSRWGIVTNGNYFHENLGNGRTDETYLGDFNFTYRFAQNELASVYTGVGFRYLTDRQQTDFGFNFTYGGDWFPVRPFIVSANIDAGNLGHAFVFHARASVGAIWQGIEVYAGYDYLSIGDARLQGPMAGVRFWF